MKSIFETRWTNFWITDMALTSPRGSFILRKNGKDLTAAIRAKRNGESKPFVVEGLDENKRGYLLEGLSRDNVNEVYSKFGIDYVSGVIKRYKDESFFNRNFTPLNYFYKEAKKFKQVN